jgi:Asp-tRNA(Asn)/Glu-tRNA(Gln) amidotransferase A subunit family amidase
MADLTLLTAEALLAGVKTGGLTAVEVAESYLDRIAVREPLVRAWSHVDPGATIRAAAEIDSGAHKGPLAGLPVGVKDVILTAQMPTQHNSPHYQGAFPKLDAACVAILRAAGAVILGKTETVEFAATGRKAPTRNPSDFERTPGGSSSGSAAAVADRQAPLALGTQTGGSIIRPASYCGVFAMKPTWGLVSAEGAKSFAPSLDTIGWFARAADDLALVYEVFDPQGGAAAPLSLEGARIAVCRTPFWDEADVSSQAALTKAAELLRRAGTKVVDLELPPPFDQLLEAHLAIMSSEGQSAFLAEHRLYGAALHPNIRAYVENAAGYGRGDLLGAYNLASRCRESFDRIAGDFAAVLTISTVGEAPLGLSATGPMTFNAMWTLLHTPCINVPGLKGVLGLPVGVTLTGPRYADRSVLRAAAALAGVMPVADALG